MCKPHYAFLYPFLSMSGKKNRYWLDSASNVRKLVYGPVCPVCGL